MAKSIVTQLKETGKVTRGWIGVAIQTVTPELAQSFGLAGEKGALVSEVVKDGPADKAGMKSGDIILEFDGKTVHEMNELPRIVAATPVGRKAAAKVLRDGREMTVTITVDRLKDNEEEAAAKVPDKLGMGVAELTRELAAKLGLGESKGVVVVEVKPGSIAEEAGIARGDIVKEVNGTRIDTVDDYEKAIAARKKGGMVRLLLKRGDSSLFVALKVD